MPAFPSAPPRRPPCGRQTPNVCGMPARLKGAHTIVTVISEAVAVTIVDLGIDWSEIEPLRDLRAGLRVALQASPQAMAETGS